MLLNMFHGKIHRATVTEACLEYMGSITIDSELLELSGIMPGERVQLWHLHGCSVERTLDSSDRLLMPGCR